MLPAMREKPESPYLKPKQFTDWYALDYFRRARRLWSYWKWLLGVPVGVCIVWLVAEEIRGHRSIYQAGPVSPKHRGFNNDCHQCHTQPLQTGKRLAPWNAHLVTVPDAACQTCHPHMPDHNDQQVSTPSCAACHREHRGKPWLQWVEDGHCTACHKDLHRNDKQPCSVDASVRQFEGTRHPEFRWPADTGTVRFNHQVHCTQGVLQVDRTIRHLDCQTCHQPEDDGRHMKPVNYENHCKSCHPLVVQVAGEWQNPQVRMAVHRSRREPAPHKDPATVREALRQRYVGLAREQPAILQEPVVPAPVRTRPGRQPQPPLVIDQEGPWVDYQLQAAERILFAGPGGCRSCHPVRTAWKAGQLPTYARAQIPSHWLSHAVFRHADHQTTACTDCHAQASASQRTSDVLMPAMAICQRCHNAADGPRLGARTDCVACHRYHDRKQDHWYRREKERAVHGKD